YGPYPNLFFAGPGFTAPDGHPIPLLRALVPWPVRGRIVGAVATAATPDEARERVREVQARYHPTFLKIFFDDLPPGTPHLSREVLRAAIAEAKALGIRPVVHISLPEDMVAAAEEGATLIMHTAARAPLKPEQIARLKELGVPFVTTLRVLEALAESHRAPSVLEAGAIDPRVLSSCAKSEGWNLKGFE